MAISIWQWVKNRWSPPKEMDLEGMDKADHILNRLITGEKVPGLAIMVRQRGETVFQKGYGYADWDTKKEVDPEKTIFRIASVSKPIAATALAKMVEEGTIDLDASFYEYVPYFPKKKYDFTIRQLAAHIAGIRGYMGKEYALDKPYSIKESLVIFQEDPLLFPPGEGYHYNSYDWVMVSLAMQEAGGIPFDSYTKEKVLAPMGMNSTFPEHSQEKHPLQAKCYTKTKFGLRLSVPVNNTYKLAGGGYVSSASDILKLGEAYLNKKAISPEMEREFLQSEVVNGKPTYYGLGWQVSMDKKGRRFFGHIGNSVGAYSNFFVYPDHETVVVVLINCTNPNVQDVLDKVIDCFLS